MIDLMRIKSAITECFASDRDLIERYHVASGSGLDGCVDKTMRDVAGFDPSFRFYPVYEDGQLVAYWGTELGKFINLIFVKPSHRRSDFMKSFWEKVQNSLEPTFYSGIYKKNEPAAAFYRRYGRIIREFDHEGLPALVFQFEKVGS